MDTESLGSSMYRSLEAMWVRLGSFLPRLLSAFIVLVVGIVVSILLGKLVQRVLELLKVDTFAERAGLRQVFKENKYALTVSGLVAGIVRWFFYILTLVAVSDILGIPQLTQFLVRVAYYLPNVLIAVVILAVGLVVARFVHTIILGSLTATRFSAGISRFLAALARWTIVLFSALAALYQVGIAPGLIQILFTGFVVMFALAGGLAFGLGGKDRAQEMLRNVQNEFGRGKARGAM